MPEYRTTKRRVGRDERGGRGCEWERRLEMNEEREASWAGRRALLGALFDYILTTGNSGMDP